MKDTVADRDGKIASIMGEGVASVEAASRALDECSGNVTRAKALLYGDSKEATRHEAMGRNIKPRPFHHLGQQEDDADESLAKQSVQHNSSGPDHVVQTETGNQNPRDILHVLHSERSTMPLGMMAISNNQVASNPPFVGRRNAQQGLPVTPGAVAVVGPDAATTNDDDEYTLTAHASTRPSPAAQSSVEPVSARLVHDTEHAIEILEDQMRQYGEELRQLRREQENVAIGQVIDEEAQDVNQEDDSTTTGPRTKWAILAITILAIVGIVLGAVLSTRPDIAPTTTTPTTRAPTTSAPTTTAPTSLTLPTPTLPATRAAAITAFINNITLSGNKIEYPVPLEVRAATPEERTVAWLIEEDPLQMVAHSASDRERLQQRYALLTFWFSDELDSPWRFDEGWLTGSHECDWYGVGCNERIVIAFDMGVYVFDGTAYHGNSLQGSIPNDIALLTALEHLDLQANHYMTGTIPTTLGDLKQLRHVNFWNIGFSPCPLPPLGRLTNLEHLDLGAIYSLTGKIPESINSLTKLTYLDLQDSKLSGTIPSTIGDLTLLEYLNIEDNPAITGTIPEALYGLLQLKELKFGSMGLSGTLSNSLGELSLLERFWIGDNSLTGSLPSSIGSLTNVKNFYIYRNDLGGTLPNTIGQWTAVTHASFSNNSFRGTIPESIGNWVNVESASFYNNDLTGTIPESIGNWVNVERASFYNNSLTGTMPDSICSHINITRGDDLEADCNSKIVCSCCTECY